MCFKRSIHLYHPYKKNGKLNKEIEENRSYKWETTRDLTWSSAEFQQSQKDKTKLVTTKELISLREKRTKKSLMIP